LWPHIFAFDPLLYTQSLLGGYLVTVCGLLMTGLSVPDSGVARSQKTSGNQEAKPSFSHKPAEEPQKTGRYNDLPARDGLPSKQSTEALFQPKQNSEKTCEMT